MTRSEHHAGVSALDRAYGDKLAGRVDEALRTATAMLRADPDQMGAALLIAWMLVDADRPFVAATALARLVDSFSRRGELPSAVVGAILAARAGEDADGLRRLVADTFGAESPRLGDVSASPPPLPSDVPAAPDLARASGGALLDAAEQTLERYLASDDPYPVAEAVPRLPLFSALRRASLERLLAALQLREHREGEHVIREGEEGTEAYVLVRGALEVVRDRQGTISTLAVLGPGALFGEMALVSDAPRAGTVTAIEPVVLLAISRERLEELAREDDAIARELGAFCRGRMLANLLRQSELLRAIDPAEQGEIVSKFRMRTFEPGDVLVRRGEEREGLFLVASGWLDVIGVEPDGEPIRLAKLGPGDVAGEMSLVLRRPASADVVAREPTVALELTADDFRATMAAHPRLLTELYDLAVRRDEEMRTVVGQEAVDVDTTVLL